VDAPTIDLDVEVEIDPVLEVEESHKP